MGLLRPYAIGERPGGYAQLRQKPRGLFGEPAWNSLGEYRRSKGVDSRLPPGMPSDVTRIDHARPEDSALGGYEPLPTGKQAAVSLGGLASGLASGVRRVLGSPSGAAARKRSAQQALGITGPVPGLAPPADPAEIKTFLGGWGKRFWGAQDWNTRVTNVGVPGLENRAKYLYPGLPATPGAAPDISRAYIDQALVRARSGAEPYSHNWRIPLARNSIQDAEDAAIQALTGRTYVQAPLGLYGLGFARPAGRQLGPSTLLVPKTNYKGVEALGALGAATAGGGLGYGAYRAATAGDEAWRAGQAGPAPATNSTPAAPAGGGASNSPPSGDEGSGLAAQLGGYVNQAADYAGQHPWQVGLGAAGLAGLGGAGLWLAHRKRQQAEEERQRLQEGMFAKAGSADPFAGIVRDCPTAAGVLAYCAGVGYGEVEIRHMIVKAAGAVPGLAEEFDQLFGTAAGSLGRVTDVAPSRVKYALGFGSGFGNPTVASPRPTPVSKPPATPQPQPTAPQPQSPAALAPRPPVPAETAPPTAWREYARGQGYDPGSTMVGNQRVYTGDIGPDGRRLLGIQPGRQGWMPSWMGGGPTQSQPVWAGLPGAPATLQAPTAANPQTVSARNQNPSFWDYLPKAPPHSYAGASDIPFGQQAAMIGGAGAILGAPALTATGPGAAALRAAGTAAGATGAWLGNHPTTTTAGLMFGPMAAEKGIQAATGSGPHAQPMPDFARDPAKQRLFQEMSNNIDSQVGSGDITAAQAETLKLREAHRINGQPTEQTENQLAQAGITPPPPPLPDTLSREALAAVPPEQAPRMFEHAQQKLNEVVSRLQIKGDVDPKAEMQELVEPLRYLVASRAVAGGLKEDPQALFARVSRNGVSIQEMRDIAGIPGNEGLSGGQQGPNALEGVANFFSSPEVSPLFKGLVGIGVPVAALGLLASAFGNGGLGSLLMSVLGIGAAAYGAQQGGLLSGLFSGNPAPSPGAPAGGAPAGAAGGSPSAPAAGAPAPAPAGASAAGTDVDRLAALPPDQRINTLFPAWNQPVPENDPFGLGAMQRNMALRGQVNALSDRYDVPQLQKLLTGVSPEQRAAMAAQIREHTGGRTGFSPEVSQELLQALESQG